MTDTDTRKAGTVNLLDKITKGRTLPEGCDAWAIRSVRADFTSSHGFRWPFPGRWAQAPGPLILTNTDGCPSEEGDGICAATTWEGMASGGIPAGGVLLLVAYATADVLGRTEDEGKFRASRMLVVDVLDGAAVVRAAGAADLRYADLRYADLRGADLRYANLRGADLTDATYSSDTVWPDGFTVPADAFEV